MKKGTKIALWSLAGVAALATTYYFYNENQKAKSAKLANQNQPTPETAPTPVFEQPLPPAKAIIPKGIKNIVFDPSALPTIAVKNENLASSFNGTGRMMVDKDNQMLCCGNV